MDFFLTTCVFVVLLNSAIAQRVSFVPNSPASLFGQALHCSSKTNSLYYVDSSKPLVVRHDLIDGSFYQTAPGDALYYLFVAPISTKEFGLGIDSRMVTFEWNGVSPDSTVVRTAIEVEQNIDAVPRGLNIGKTDPCNRLFVGTYRDLNCDIMPGVQNASLYRYSNCDGVVRLLNDQFFYAGMTWDPKHHKFYLVDICNLVIKGYHYDSYSGGISNEWIVYDFRINGQYPGFIPYDITIDTNGFLWATAFGGSKIFRINPWKSKIEQTIPMPVRRVASIGFCGKDLKTLYVTSVSDPADPIRYGSDLLANGPPESDAGRLIQVEHTGAEGYESNNLDA